MPANAVITYLVLQFAALRPARLQFETLIETGRPAPWKLFPNNLVNGTCFYFSNVQTCFVLASLFSALIFCSSILKTLRCSSCVKDTRAAVVHLPAGVCIVWRQCYGRWLLQTVLHCRFCGLSQLLIFVCSCDCFKSVHFQWR